MRIIRLLTDIMIGGLVLLIMILWVPGLCGMKTYCVSSGSMEPALHVGEAIYVEPCGFAEIQENDIVTYSLNDGRTNITHRAVSVDPEKRILKTKGDANAEADHIWISEHLLIGKVRWHIPYLGNIVYFLSDRAGKLLFLGCLLWLLALEMITEQWIIPENRKGNKLEKT